MLHDNLSVNAAGHLTVNGADTVELAEKYGTPLYLLDEDRVRAKCRTYLRAMKEYFGPESHPLYASKALSFKGIYKIASEEGMSVDVVSPGELYIALAAGFDAGNIYFHGNAKTMDDIRFAIDSGLGYFVCDNETELRRISDYAVEKGIRQKILLRLTPGIDPHTFDAVNTGKVDSKFGSAITTGQAEAITKLAMDMPGIELRGFHCHIGSQIFDEKPFCDAADLMMTFLVMLRDKYGFTASTLNLGGGIGVRYTEADPYIDIDSTLKLIGAHLHKICDENNFPMPQVLMEPGRSLVADAGVTIYTIQNIKNIPGFKSYTAIDGGMPDNPRYALYGSRYTVLLANRADEAAEVPFTVAGRCCESGDLIGENMLLPKDPKVGDYLAVLVTGAYNYAMASNYNCIPRPPIVMIADGKDTLAVRRETYADLMGCHN
ncbi:MAG: diaminopimelate decarboxylase [Clostridia bacterium]|nr:diaminopimelate decarboxylase [Clostridia bacterium]